MTNRAEEVACLRAIVEQLHSPCVHGDNPCDECLAIPLRDYAEEARREEMVECGRVLFGIADEFDAMASTQIGNEIVHGALTDQAFFVRNLATTLGCVEPAAIRARGEKK